MANYLDQSLAITDRILSSNGFENNFNKAFEKPEEENAIESWSNMNYLLLRKAEMHIKAVLIANTDSNIHSMAVQMRIVLECAGQIIAMTEKIINKSEKNMKVFKGYINKDFFHSMIRLSKGKVDQNDLLRILSEIDVDHKGRNKKVGGMRFSDTVKELEFGPNWYQHLSMYFYHSDLDNLKDISFYGGVGSNNSTNDILTFAFFLDYLAHQVIFMIVCVELCLDASGTNESRLCQATDLLENKKRSSDFYRKKLKRSTPK